MQIQSTNYRLNNQNPNFGKMYVVNPEKVGSLTADIANNTQLKRLIARLERFGKDLYVEYKNLPLESDIYDMSRIPKHIPSICLDIEHASLSDQSRRVIIAQAEKKQQLGQALKKFQYNDEIFCKLLGIERTPKNPHYDI